MPGSLTIEEHISSVWKYILTVSLLDAIVFLILFLVNNTPLLVGIFRLVAFIGFAVFVLALLQMMGKTKEIKFALKEDKLYISYYLSLEKSQEEIFEVETIDQVKNLSAPAIWFLIPRNDSAKLQISFTDTSNKLSILRFQGHDLYVSKADAQKVVRFLDENIPSKVN
jgi:hypothetical protein